MDYEADRLARVEREVGSLKGEVAVLHQKLKPIEDGFAGLVAFQTRGTRYFDRAEAVLDEDQKRREDWRWRIKVAIVVIGPLMVIAILHWYSFTQDVIEMDKEWHASKDSQNHQKSFFSPSDPVYATPREDSQTHQTAR